MKEITVLVADNGEIFRNAVVRILADREEIKVVSACSTGTEAIEKALKLKPDIIILDKYISNCDFVEVSKTASKELPKTYIIITQPYKDADPLSSLKVKARAYIDKDIPVDVLPRIIMQVYLGESFLSPEIASRLLKDYTSLINVDMKQQKLDNDLTAREIEVLTFITKKGMTNREIAKTMCISPGTVRCHLNNILGKLHVHTRLQAAIIARESRITGNIINGVKAGNS